VVRLTQVPDVRIVSLLPSATEIVCLLGLADNLVGVSADSDWPVEVVKRLPVVNTVAIDTSQLSSAQIDALASDGHGGASLYHVNRQLLRHLHPDLIITQETCEVCAVSRRDVEDAARTLGYRAQILSLSPVNLEQVLEDIDHVAQVTGVPDRARSATTSLRARLDVMRVRVATLERPRVFCMEWLDPPWTAGHWVPEMVDIAGGRDQLGTWGGPSRRVDWHEVVDYSPQVMVLMPCSLELERIVAEFPLLRQLPAWSSLPAVGTGQVFAVNTQLFSRSGPRLVDGTETLARILHPNVFHTPLSADHALRLPAWS
jgi:iron complex transport system substrate-binding protein